MADFDDSEVIRGSELRENADQAALKFLFGDYSRLVQTTADFSQRLDSVDSTMVEVQNTLSQLCNQLGIRPIEAETSRQTPPVTYSDPYVCDDLDRLPLANRKSLMPEFDGSNASAWLSKVERFFSVGSYSDLDKLDLVALSLEGDVLLWFDWEMTRREFHSWDEFRRQLFLKFGAAPEKSSVNVAEILEERASYTEKKGTVSASVTEFEELSAQVIGLDDSHLEQILNKGLKTEMKEVLKLKEPVRLEKHKKSRCLEASMFNFKRKKKRIKRRHNQLKYHYASVREDGFNTLSHRESWRKQTHENLQIVSGLLGFSVGYFRCHKEYGLARLINWSQVRVEYNLMQGKLFCKNSLSRNMPSITVIVAQFKFKHGLATRIGLTVEIASLLEVICVWAECMMHKVTVISAKLPDNIRGCYKLLDLESNKRTQRDTIASSSNDVAPSTAVTTTTNAN